MARKSIFDEDPEARPAKREVYSDDTVGRFHAGRQVNGIPETLTEWRITTGDMAVADAVAQLYGGEPIETESTSENFIDVFTDRPKISVILSGTDAIKDDLKLWNGNVLVHHCDGFEYLSPDEQRGEPCGCKRLFAERKDMFKAKMGPGPSVDVFFRLADDPELGIFRFHSGGWSFYALLDEYHDDLSAVKGEAIAELELELVEYVAKRGPMKGKNVSYVVPKLSRIRSYNSAIAEAA